MSEHTPWTLRKAEAWAAQMRSEGRDVYILHDADGIAVVVDERETRCAAELVELVGE